MRDLVIIGAGGFGREVAEWARKAREDWGYTAAPLRWDSVILCTTDDKLVYDVDVVFGCVVAIGDTQTRKRVASDLEGNSEWEKHAGFIQLLHSSVKHEIQKIGWGAIICQNVIISINCKIGQHVHINFACTIGHDCIIGDFVTLSPGVHISGNVTIGDEVFIGTGAVIREKLTIGKGATIGMGAVVVKDVPPGVTVVGNPARDINMSRKLYWPIRSKKAQAEPVAYETNQNNESGFLNPLLLGGVEDGYISYDGEKRKVHPDDVEKFMACVQEHRA